MRADFGEELEQLYDIISSQTKQMLKLKKQKEELSAKVFGLSNQLEVQMQLNNTLAKRSSQASRFGGNTPDINKRLSGAIPQ